MRVPWATLENKVPRRSWPGGLWGASAAAAWALSWGHPGELSPLLSALRQLLGVRVKGGRSEQKLPEQGRAPRGHPALGRAFHSPGAAGGHRGAFSVMSRLELCTMYF